MTAPRWNRILMASWLAGSLLLPGSFASAQTGGVTISVDAGARRRAISPFIYGVSHATQAQAAELNTPLNRNGGNAASRYHWQANATNRGADWYFQSIPYAGAQAGAEVDGFIADSRAAGAAPLLTIPTLGWVARLGDNRSRLTSFSITKYGAQAGRDSTWYPDSGNGLRPDGTFVANDPQDANVVVDPAFQRGWVQYLRAKWGPAASGGPRLFSMDNEPSLWHLSHRDVHPAGATLEEVRDKHLAYASMVKDTEPDALVLGPEEWGWSGYFYSGYDQKYSNDRQDWSRMPDREAHGGMDALPWLLTQWRERERTTGRRLLDVLTVHYYPQGGEFGSGVTSSQQQLRNRSTRSLWDPNYVDESWIDAQVALIPRLQGWARDYYPGTRVGITEYNWGAEEHISGALAQADVLGIFGREGLDYGVRWGTPAAATPTFKAMKLYRNYDGQRSAFGDVSVACTVPDPDRLSAFAAERSSDGALTIMVLNKSATDAAPVSLQLSRFTPGSWVQRWQLTSANTLSQLPELTLSGTTLNTSVPAQSITLYVIPVARATNQPPVARILSSALTGPAPLFVSFDGSASTDPEGSPLSYLWVSSDGARASGARVGHTYTREGVYQGTLTVTDSSGLSSSSAVTITVTSTTAPVEETPAAPSDFYAQASKSEVSLRWKDNAANEQGFSIERSPDVTPLQFAEIGRAGASSTLYVDAGRATGRYVYRVRAYSGSRASAYSNQDVVSVK